MASNGNYEVGFGKPPKAHQWVKGQSGNKAGRRPGARGLRTDLAAELQAKVPVTENGKRKMLTKQQVAVKALVSKAMKGDMRANAKLLDLVVKVFGLEPEDAAPEALPASDKAILDAYMARHSTVHGGLDE